MSPRRCGRDAPAADSSSGLDHTLASNPGSWVDTPVVRALLLALMLTTGCAATRVAVPAYPVNQAQRADYRGLRLELQGFDVVGESRADSQHRVDNMRKHFLTYVRARNDFSEIVDARWVWSASQDRGSPGTLILDATVEVEHSQWRTYVLDALGGTLVWPLTPQWGTARVRVTAWGIAPDGWTVWRATGVGEADYAILLYSWWRTEAVEIAYEKATARAFADVARHLASSRAHVVAQLEPPPPAQSVATLPTQPAVSKTSGVLGHATLAQAPALRPLDTEKWIVAAMDVRDVSGTIDATLVRSLSNQVRVETAQLGLKVVERSTQAAALESVVESLKLESYDGCYDEACQIPLGKTLAASHLLRSQVTRFGGTCVLNGEMIDLMTEVAVTAASVKADCSEEGFLEASRTLMRMIVRR